jgi:hypothetical protein
MEKSDWSKAYNMLLLVAVVVLPATLFVILASFCTANHLFEEFNLGPVAPGQGFVGKLGFTGIAATGGAALLAILGLGFKRHNATAVFVASGIVLASELFLLYAICAILWPLQIAMKPGIW